MYADILYAHGYRDPGDHAQLKGGVLLAFRHNFPYKIVDHFADPNGRYLVAHILIDDEPVTIVNVHVVGSVSEISDMYSRIGKEVAKGENEKVIWCGDFNAVMEDIDRTSDVETPRNKLLRDWVEAWEMTDIWRVFHPDIKRYTHFAANKRSLARLDMIFGSPSFMSNLSIHT